jgi:prepilin-type N-terminal cleavage/methylation domain-containing protein
MITKISKKGFTLIEIVIVISIIALLSVTAVGTYVSYRKASLLDFAADNIVSQFYQMRSKTLYGDGNSERFDAIQSELSAEDTDVTVVVEDLEPSVPEDVSSLCYGMYLPEGSKSDRVYFAESNFIDKKVWFNDNWEYGGCESFVFTDEAQSLAYDSDIKIISFEKSTGGDIKTPFLIGFTPPSGEAYFDGDLFSNAPIAEDVFNLKIQFGEADDIRYQRIIKFDLFNLTANVEKVN